MKSSPRMWLLLVSAAVLGLPGPVRAETIPSIGAGMAVLSIDRSTSFDVLNVDGLPITDFQDGGLWIRTEGDCYLGTGTPVFDPFHGASNGDRAFYFPFTNGGGNHTWVEIETTDAKKIYGLEFMYGNGWTTGQIYGPYPWGNHDAVLEWQTWNGATLVSLGTLGITPLLEMGTIVGFSDITGFDRLRLRCTSAASGDTSLQALALDSLRVALTYLLDVAPGRVPSSTLTLFPIAPNPTPGAASMAFELPSSGEVRLRIYDATGRLVRSLVDGTHPSGKGFAGWDGMDRTGRRVRSGVYLAQLTAGDQKTERRFCVVY
jgi:hypothetical protein